MSSTTTSSAQSLVVSIATRQSLTTLTTKQQQAAVMVADGGLSWNTMIARLKIHRTTLSRWIKLPEFRELVRATREAMADEVVCYAITDKRHRVSVLQELEDRHVRLLEARANDPSMADVPGADTGLLVKTLKVSGVGRDREVLTEYKRDEVGRDIIAIHEQARKETGEDRQRLELTGKDGGPIELAAVDLRSRLLQEIEQLSARLPAPDVTLSAE